MEQHLSEEVLVDLVEAAKQQIEIGGFYSHYKNPNQSYLVKDIAILEANDELCVIYQATYGKELTFVRSVSSWLDVVRVSTTQVPRFSKVTK